MDTEIEMLSKVLRYDPETGDLWWRVHVGGRSSAGTRAGYVIGEGYRGVTYRGKMYLAHRVCWALFYGEWPTLEIDHDDRIKTNNRIVNLFDRHHIDNCANRIESPLGKSGVRWVTWNAVCGKWQVQFRRAGRSIYVGLFDSLDKAKSAAESARRAA